MDKRQSTSRLFDIKEQVILTQTDTTVGFVSQNGAKLAKIKSRPQSKPFIKVFTSLHVMKQHNKRIPKKFKNMVRRSSKRTFIVKNEAFRIASHPLNSQVLRNLVWCYSTSANESSKSYDREFCIQKADIIVEDKGGLEEKTPSQLYKLNNRLKKRLR